MARYNRNPNPALDNNITGWTTSNTKAALRRVAATRPDGASGQIGDARSNGTARARVSTTNSGGGLAPVVAGQNYVVSIYVYQGSGGTQNVRLDVDFANASGVYTSTAAGSPVVAVPNNTWTRITDPVTVPAGSAFISTYVEFYTTVDNTYIGVSSAMVEDGTTSPNYRDGNSSGWAWTGTAGNSQSRDLNPTAAAGSDQTVTAGTTVNLSAAGSSDPEGGTLSYAWTVQDAAGTGLTNANITNRLTSAASFTAPTPPSGPAAVTLRLTVTDPGGNTATDDVVVTVNPAVLLDLTGSGGVLLGGSADAVYNRGNDVTGEGGLSAGGAADVLATVSEVVSGSGGPVAGGTALGDLLTLTPSFTTGSGGLSLDGTGLPALFITPSFVVGSGGTTLGGTGLPPLFITPSFWTASGGVELGGEAEYRYRATSVPAAVTIEWDLDGDGRFTRPEETITPYVISVESLTGRDYPSQLTGRAGPGKLRVELLNQDNRFSHFNAASPLNQGGMELQVGSRIRLRTIESTDPDVTVLAQDEFDRADSSSLGTAPTGQTWSGTDFAIISNRVGMSAGTGLRISTMDVGSAAHFVQGTFFNLDVESVTGTGNVVGLIYRYVNTSNYSRLQYNVATKQLRIVDRIAGADTNRGFFTIDVYERMVLGVYVTGTTVRYYLDGVLLGTDTAGVASGTRVGLYAVRATDAHGYPRMDDFVVWNKPAAASTGVLWSGHVAGIEESVELGPRRKVVVDAEGPLSLAASSEVYPTSSPIGRKTGLVVGNTLARAGLLDPPGPIALGDLTTGAFGYEKSKTLEVCRDFEEAELGFLFETQEGRIGFDNRTARASRTSQAVFADYEGAQLGYHKLEPRDWRREIVNRVEAGVASVPPSRENRNFIWTNYADPPAGLPSIPTNNLGVMWVRPSDAPTPIVRGQLLLAIVAAPGHAVYGAESDNIAVNSVVWMQPPGWVPLDDAPTFTGTNKPNRNDYVPPLRVYAKIADGTEASAVAFGYMRGDLTQWNDWYGETYSSVNRLPYITSLYNLDNFFGDIKEGIAFAEAPIWSSGFSGYTPPTVFPDWGPEHPSLFVTAIAATLNGFTTPKLAENVVYPPTNYRSLPASPIYRFRNGGTAANGVSTMLAIADRSAAVSVESPQGWYAPSNIGPGTAHKVQVVSVAVRGKNGDPPIKNGNVTVQRDSVASQKKYKVIRSHREESNLFPDSAAATTYGDLVLSRYSGERPIMALSFWANTTIAHRAQAITRRVGDRITVESDNATGLNYSGDYFIESIGHVITNGGKQWEVTYELSPA